jgi:hypothetical protein
VTYDFGIHFALLNVRCTLGHGLLNRWTDIFILP